MLKYTFSSVIIESYCEKLIFCKSVQDKILMKFVFKLTCSKFRARCIVLQTLNI